jgi:hypothetical protein
MSAEHVPKHGKAGVAFAGAELKDAWLLIGSMFAGLAMGGLFGWVVYVGLPVLGYLGTKAYIDWKSNRLAGYLTELFYRLGWTGYSTAFNRKKKLFIGDGKVVNPSALQMGAIVRAEASSGVAVDDVDTSTDFAAPLIEHDESQLVN